MSYSCKTAGFAVLVVCWTVSLGVGADENAEPSLRLVPQVAWEQVGWEDDDRRWLASPDGRFAVAQIGRTLHIRDRRIERTAWILPQHASYRLQLAFSPDSRYLARSDGLLLDLEQDRQIRIETAGGIPAFSPDGRRLAVAQGSSAPQVRLFGVSGEVLGSYPGTLALPDSLVFSEDGRRLIVHGRHGRIQSILGGYPAVATVELDTGKVTMADLRHEPPKAGREAPPAPEKLRPGILGPVHDGLYWDDSRDVAVHAIKLPRLRHRTDVWDVGRGRLLKSVETRHATAGGFLGKEALLINKKLPGRPEATANILRLDTGQEQEMPITGLRFSPSPDARYLAAIRQEGRPADVKSLRSIVTVWKLTAPPQKVWETAKPGHNVHFDLGWARLNDEWVLLIQRDVRWTGKRALDVHVAEDGRLLSSLFDDYRSVQSFAVSPGGERLSVGWGNERFGGAALVDLATGEERLSVDRFPIWVSAVAFVDDARVVLATHRGHLALWNLKDDRLDWEIETGLTGPRFHHWPGSKYLIVQARFDNSIVMTVDDGLIMRRTPRAVLGTSPDREPWNSPQLIGDGSCCLEVDSGVAWFRLAETATGDTLLTFARLPEDQWAVWTPQGFWSGSENAREHLAVFRGDRLLPADDLQVLRRPDQIEKMLRRCLP